MLPAGQAVALITAAGLSSRMGQPKALLPWSPAASGSKRPLVLHQVHVLAGFADVVVVLGHQAAEIMAAAPLPPGPGRYVVNDDYRQGRSRSLAAGGRALAQGAGADHEPDLGPDRPLLIVAVDQPLDEVVVAAMLAAWRPGAQDMLQPVHAGRRGHPILLAPHVASRLVDAARFDQGLRGLTGSLARRRATVEVDTLSIFANLNRPEDLRRPNG